MLVLKNAVIFDGHSDELITGGHLVIEDGLIREVADRDIHLPGADVLDVAGRFVMPGLIDLHFHAYGATLDLRALDRMPKALLTCHAIRNLENALMRGFTTVRDPGGGDIGLWMAIEQGLISGPRFLYGGRALSQTGGHGDLRRADEEASCGCGYSGALCQVVDGVEQVRKAAREELRRGADHLKIFVSGGVSSPTDPLWMPQFSDEELTAAIAEARSRRKYVVAHCHTDDGARRCAEAGVRSIEHATDISPDTARMIAAAEATYIVPTLSVMHQIQEYGRAFGFPPERLSLLEELTDRARTSIANCAAAGVRMGFGTDIIGAAHQHLQAREFRYRAEISKPIDVLRSATSISAEIVQRSGEIGTIAAGARADLIVLDCSPLEDITIFERSAEHMPVIIKDGKCVRCELKT